MKQQKTKTSITKKTVKSNNLLLAEKHKSLSVKNTKKIEKIIITKFGRAIKELAKT